MNVIMSVNAKMAVSDCPWFQNAHKYLLSLSLSASLTRISEMESYALLVFLLYINLKKALEKWYFFSVICFASPSCLLKK